ncbi:MAG: DUF433 domain-containing protein [Gemmataceae bacterium]|nr:DUF433 domain-containing protein [Gemmataceae bacterium]
MNAVETEPLIRKTPDVIGGQACIRRSRIAVFMLVEDKQLGATDIALLNSYPTLTQQDLDAAWAYYAANRDEIDTAIRLNNEAE